MKKVSDLKRVNPLTMVDLSERFSFDPILRWNPHVEHYLSLAYGPQHFSRISKALTRPSCYSCIRVNTIKSSVDFVADKLSAILKENEEKGNGNPGQVSPECVGCVLMGSSGRGQVSKCRIPGLDNVLFVRGSGPHTIDYGCSTDGKPLKEVIVSRKCAEAVLRGAQIYVPGVLACSAGVEQGDTVAVSVAVEKPMTQDGGWGTGMTRGIVLQGSEIDPLYYERRGLYIGQGKAVLSRAGIFRVLQGVAVNMSNRVFKLPSFHDVLEGEIFLQNLPSIITAHALDPKSGERVLDMCAAPGGKTTAIAILMKDEGEIIACDRSHNKVNDIQKLAAEMGLKCITTFRLDALKSVRRRNECDDDTTIPDCSTEKNNVTKQSLDAMKLQEEVNASSASELPTTPGKASEESVSNEKANDRTYISKADIRKELRRTRNGPGRNQGTGGRAENSNGFDPNSFDRVLLDGPCSALGLRPRLFAGEVTLEELRKHAKYQKKMLDQAVQLVRPGGVLVYSTCTINPGENEAVVRYALDKYKFLSLAPQHPKIGGPGLVGHFKYPDGYIEEWLRPGEEELVQRFDPSSSLDTIGFFIAKFSVANKET